jgi:serine/threonine protein kinase
MIGTIVDGKYNITKSLGSDRIGDMWLADDLINKKVVMLRIFGKLAEYVLSQEIFKGEVEKLTRLQHPHVLKVLEIGQDRDNLLYLVMDYCPHGDLRGYLQAHSLTIGEKVEFARQLATALYYIHQYGVAHLDVAATQSAKYTDAHWHTSLSRTRTYYISCQPTRQAQRSN